MINLQNSKSVLFSCVKCLTISEVEVEITGTLKKRL